MSKRPAPSAAQRERITHVRKDVPDAKIKMMMDGNVRVTEHDDKIYKGVIDRDGNMDVVKS